MLSCNQILVPHLGIPPPYGYPHSNLPHSNLHKTAGTKKRVTEDIPGSRRYRVLQINSSFCARTAQSKSAGPLRPYRKVPCTPTCPTGPHRHLPVPPKPARTFTQTTPMSPSYVSPGYVSPSRYVTARNWKEEFAKADKPNPVLSYGRKLVKSIKKRRSSWGWNCAMLNMTSQVTAAGQVGLWKAVLEILEISSSTLWLLNASLVKLSICMGVA